MDRKLQAQQETLRLPLYSTEQQRQIPGKFSSWSIKDQVLVNCFPVTYKDPIKDDGGVTKIQSRSGLESPELSVSFTGVLTSLIASEPLAVQAMSQCDDVIVVAFGDSGNYSIVQYRPTANTCLLIGSITGGATYTPGTDPIYLSEIEVGGVPAIAVTVSKAGRGGASAGYYASTTSGLFTASSLTQITDVDFPPNATYSRKIVGPIVQLNNVHYVMTEVGVIHGSYPSLSSGAPSQITVWDTLGYIGAIQSPDRGVGLIRYKHHLIALGEETMEFFSDEGIGQPALPIRRTDQAFLRMGVVSAKSVINVDDTLYFIGKSVSNNIAFFKLEGYTPVQLSQPAQSLQVSDRAKYRADLQVFSMYGTRHIITNVNAATDLAWEGQNEPENVTTNSIIEGNLVYCIDSNAWWIWAPEHDLHSALVGGNNERLYVANITTSSNFRRYVWGVGTDPGVSTYGLHPRVLLEYDETSDNAYFDAYRVSNTANIDYYRIPVVVLTNTYQFGSLSRTSLRKLKLVADKIGTNVSGGIFDTFNTEGYYLNLAIWKSEDPAYSDTPRITRSLDLRQVDTSGGVVNNNNYYFHALGVARNWKFGIFISSYTPVRLEALEVTVSQNTH